MVSRLACGPGGRPRGEIGDCTPAGENRNHRHEQEDLDQSRARKRHLLKERQSSQRGPVEWQGSPGQQQDGDISSHPEGDGDLNRPSSGGSTKPGAQRRRLRLGDAHPWMPPRRICACGRDGTLG